jgi:hypothetical protein
MLITAYELLTRNADPSETEVHSPHDIRNVFQRVVNAIPSPC